MNERPIRPTGWEFTADPGDGVAYTVREEFPNRHVEFCITAGSNEIMVSLPFIIVKLAAQKIMENEGVRP